jgi:hypothetical protein
MSDEHDALYINDRELHRRVARHLGWDAFRRALADAQSRGFPQKSRLFCGWYWPKVAEWFDEDQGLFSPPAPSVEPEPSVDRMFREGVVYFFRAGDFIKIGFSRDWRARLRTMQTGSPHPIIHLWSMPGSHATEGEMHSRFAHLRANGEWFEAAPDLLTYIDGLRKAAGSP